MNHISSVAPAPSPFLIFLWEHKIFMTAIDNVATPLHGCDPSRRSSKPQDPARPDSFAEQVLTPCLTDLKKLETPTTGLKPATRRHRDHSTATAFTMVELLAATALSTLLFISALYVIRSLAQITPAEVRPSDDWKLATRRQIEWDLANADVFRQDDHGLVLGGYGSLDAQTHAATHLPVVVTYSLKSIGNQIWLVREQTSLDPLRADLTFTEPVCAGIKSFTVTGSYLPRTFETAPFPNPLPLTFRTIAGAQGRPDRVRVLLDLQNDPVPVMNTVLFLK